MKVGKRKHINNVVFKLDINKAYDHIDWVYVKRVMLKLGFAPKLARWILMCVEYVGYSVVNNNLVDPVILGRGLRQNDPFSSYLFIMCEEGLLALIHGVTRRGVLHGIYICNDALVISHMLSTYDWFLFFRAT